MRFDAEVLRSELLPLLIERHFGSIPDLVVTVVDGAGSRLYRSPGELPPATGSDFEQPMFSFLPAEELRPAWVVAALPPALGRGERGGEPAAGERRSRMALAALVGGARPGPWRLLVSHRAGSLAAAVELVRRRNLAAGSVVLLLLGLTAAVLALAARQAFSLARQRSELVATASHELRTPLAAIRSLGQNLADGVVADPTRVRRYGDSIVEEGERLSSMVEQMLELSVSRSRRPAARRAVVIEELVDETIGGLEAIAADAGVEIERTASDPEAVVEGDPAALRRAIENLLTNAVRHGGGGGWVGIAVDAPQSGGEVRLTVRDRGPGIARADLPRIFEPFYRGGGERGRGGGLGLALVEEIARAHRGRVEVENAPDGGARFTLTLPASRREREA